MRGRKTHTGFEEIDAALDQMSSAHNTYLLPVAEKRRRKWGFGLISTVICVLCLVITHYVLSRESIEYSIFWVFGGAYAFELVMHLLLLQTLRLMRPLGATQAWILCLLPISKLFYLVFIVAVVTDPVDMRREPRSLLKSILPICAVSALLSTGLNIMWALL